MELFTEQAWSVAMAQAPFRSLRSTNHISSNKARMYVHGTRGDVLGLKEGTACAKAGRGGMHGMGWSGRWTGGRQKLTRGSARGRD